MTNVHRAHEGASWLFAACVVVQVFLAGLGVFDDPGAFVTHREFGYLFGWLTLVVLILSLVGRMGRRLVGASLLLLIQFGLQSVLVAVRDSQPVIAALHPLNGMAILLVTVALARASRAWRVAQAPARSALPAAEAA